MRVIVVGAGLAGLAAAQRLRDHGADVVVLEGGERLGGRVRTVRTFAGGAVVESGAEWVDSHHHEMHEILDRLGLRTLGAGQSWSMIRRWLFRNGELHDSETTTALVGAELDRLDSTLESLADLVPDPARPHARAAAAALDARSLADAANDLGLGELAQLYARRNCQGEFADEPGRVSLLFVAQQRAVSRDAANGARVLAHRIEGGLDAIVTALADELGSCIHRRAAVNRLVERGDHVEAHTDRGSFEADVVIATTSLRAMSSIEIDLPIEPLLRRAIAELGYGSIVKTAVEFDTRDWSAGYTTTDTVAQRIYEPTIDQPAASGVLMAYTGGDGGRALGDVADDARIGLIESDMRAVHSIRAARRGAFTRAWSSQPRYGGSYATYLPGQVVDFWDVLRRPHGRLLLAGEHTATWTGYMEGAVESGKRAADWALSS